MEILMKLSSAFFAAALALSTLAGCSGSDGEIAVDAASSPLTSEGNDKLFTLRIVDAREGGYPLEGLVVKVTVDGGEPLTVSYEATDTNGNGVLDKDESLECIESAENQLDASVAGKELEVELYAKIDGEETKVGSSTWTPAK
ncbi:MAG: hypothetical protein BGO98_21060 [Myxococcales bacterium 68-20]|nr:MAG: hypothetical protein BGO98_21060 [Myxococcales bacterium 68-20]